METKKKIGIIALCALTLVIGVVFVSAERPSMATSETKYIEVIRIGPLPTIEEIYLDLGGYKEVQVSYTYNIESAFSSGVTMFWAIESLGEETGEIPLAFGAWGGKGNGHESFPVCSNMLKIIIGVGHEDPTDYVKIIFYATK
jgi:hypothetical protein